MTFDSELLLGVCCARSWPGQLRTSTAAAVNTNPTLPQSKIENPSASLTGAGKETAHAITFLR